MGLVDRAKNILVTPKTEWAVVATEEPNVGAIITGYVIPLSLIPAAAQVIGMGVLGGGMGMSFGIAMAVVTLVTSVLTVYLAAFIVNALAPSFESQKDFGRALQQVAYSYTPVWVLGILNIFPIVGGVIVWLGYIYVIYLIYLGLPHIMKTPESKVVIYMVVGIGAIIVVSLILAAIFGLIVFSILGFGAASMMGR